MYMREYWVQVHKSPIVYRYVDWSITVPLQMIEIFLGEAGGTAADCSEHVSSSYNTMRLIVTAGWSIYPLGYLFGYLLGQVDEKVLNVVYNVADFVNKIAFVLACWSCAKADSEGKTAPLLGETNAAAKSRLQAEKNRIERQLRSMS